MLCTEKPSLHSAKCKVLQALALVVLLATRNTCANAGLGGCLSTPAGQSELRDLLKTSFMNGSIIFPIGDRGIIDGGLFEPNLRMHMEETPYHRIRHHRRRGRHGRRRFARDASDCRADRVCTAVFQLEEDSSRIPRYLLKATCADCSKCSNLGGTCQPVLYQMTVFKDCTNLLTDCESCRAHQQQVPVGCTCILDTLSKKR